MSPRRSQGGSGGKAGTRQHVSPRLGEGIGRKAEQVSMRPRGCGGWGPEGRRDGSACVPEVRGVGT